MRKFQVCLRKQMAALALHLIALFTVVSAASAQTGEPIGILLAAGDITGCHQSGNSSSAMADRIDAEVRSAGSLPVGVLVLGDLAYGDYVGNRLVRGSYQRCFDDFVATWGRNKTRLFPVPGNHDYTDDTSNPRVGAERFKLYFAEHIKQLDPSSEERGTNGAQPFSFAARFPGQDGWLIAGMNFYENRTGLANWVKTRLSGREPRCVLAFTHPFLNSSGHHGRGGTYDKMKPIMKELYSAGATVLISGHDHDLEQFKKQNPRGQEDTSRGVRTFVVGTGGAKLYPVPLNRQGEPVRKHPLSEKFANTSKGFLKLKLYRDGYEWSFVAVSGDAVALPIGREACNARAG